MPIISQCVKILIQTTMYHSGVKSMALTQFPAMAAETGDMNRNIGKAGIKVHIAMAYAYQMKCDNIDLLFRGAVETGKSFWTDAWSARCWNWKQLYIEFVTFHIHAITSLQ